MPKPDRDPMIPWRYMAVRLRFELERAGVHLDEYEREKSK